MVETVSSVEYLDNFTKFNDIDDDLTSSQLIGNQDDNYVVLEDLQDAQRYQCGTTTWFGIESPRYCYTWGTQDHVMEFQGGAGTDTLRYDTDRTVDMTAISGGFALSGGSIGIDLTVNAQDVEVFDLGNGNDTVDIWDSLLANVTIYADDGNDDMTGSAQADTFHGENGNDTLRGNDGNDSLYGGDGYDSIEGGDGADYINGGSYLDTIRGGNGNDTVVGGNNSDILYGDAGNDSISDGHGHDTIYGGSGNDTISSGQHNDSIDGGTGNDWIDAGSYNDVLRGGTGNDTLIGGDGNDEFIGGEDADTFIFDMADGQDQILDFSEADEIIINGASASDISVSSSNGSTTLSFGSTVLTLFIGEESRSDFDITTSGSTTTITWEPATDTGGSNDTVICTYMFERGYIPAEVYKWDGVYGQRLGAEVLAGYHAWAIPLVERVLKRSEIATQMVRPLACAWALEMAHRCDPENHPKGSLLGRAILTVGVPLCRMIAQSGRRASLGISS